MCPKLIPIIHSLRRGKKIVYTGITNNPKRRFEEHLKFGKNLSHINLSITKLMREYAKKYEEKKRIMDYKKRTGKFPQFNKTTTGKYIYGLFEKKNTSKKRNGKFPLYDGKGMRRTISGLYDKNNPPKKRKLKT